MDVTQLTTLLQAARRAVFFGGAGVSTASGIPDFRSAQGIFSEPLHATFSPEEIVSHSFYQRHPEIFFDFYREKLVYPQAQPNPCHIALAKLEARGIVSAVITQNIDGLHQQAGSRNVVELHGSVHRNYCEKCRKPHDLSVVMEAPGIPRCAACGGPVRPGVVLYQENLGKATLNQAIDEIRRADLLIVGGTSLAVYPAAGLIETYQGTHRVLINKSATPIDDQVDLVLSEDIAAVFAAVMKEMNLV